MGISNKWMRTVALRTIRLAGVYKGAHPAIAELEPLVVPKARTFIQTYDAHANYKPQHRERVDEGRAKIRELRRTIRVWSGALSAIVPGFDVGSFQGDESQPDVVLAEGTRLLAIIELHRERLSNGSELLATVTELHAAATVEWDSAQQTLAEHVRLERAVGTTKEDLQVPLMSFRMTLIRLLGPTHRDCLLLSIKPNRRGSNTAAEVAEVEQITTAPANDNTVSERNVA